MPHCYPNERQGQQVEKPKGRIPACPPEPRCERSDYARSLGAIFGVLKRGPAPDRLSPLFDSLNYEKQQGEEHNNPDRIADPKMKPSLSKTAPGDHSRSGIGSDKPARDEPRTDDRHH